MGGKKLINAKTAFAILADGSDETSKIADAFAAAMTEEVYFGPGVYGTTGVPTFSKPPIIQTAGPAHTIFKNLSAGTRMFEFERSIVGDLKTSFATFGGFQLDQNGSDGAGIKIGAQYSNLRDIWFRNQGIGGFALDMVGPTLGQFSRLHFTTCANGIRAVNCYYPHFEQVSIERLNGHAMVLRNCAAVSADGLYLDHGPGGTQGNAPEVLLIEDCSTVDISNLTSELAEGAALTAESYFQIRRSLNVNIRGGRVNHSANHGSKYLFHSDQSSIVLQGVEWQEERFGMVFLGGTGRMAARDIITGGGVDGSGSRYGILNADGPAERVEVENWRDEGTPCNMQYISASAKFFRP